MTIKKLKSFTFNKVVTEEMQVYNLTKDSVPGKPDHYEFDLRPLHQKDNEYGYFIMEAKDVNDLKKKLRKRFKHFA